MDSRNPPALTPDALRQLLEKLKEVTAEAERLREAVTRQLLEQRRSLQQRVTPIRRVRSKRKQR